GNYGVAGAGQIDLVINLFQCPRPELSQEGNPSDFTLLQFLIGIEGARQYAGVACNFGAAHGLGPGSAGLQLLQLVTHLRSGIFGGITQSGVEPGNDGGNAFNQNIEFPIRFGKSGFNFRRKGFGSQQFTQLLLAPETIGERQLVMLDVTLGARVEQGYAGAGQDGRYPAQKFFVHHTYLSKICDLGRAAKVGNRGQQEILDHGPQQNVSTEFFRMLCDAGTQLFGGTALIANCEAFIGAADGGPDAILVGKERCSSGSDFDLLVVSGALQGAAALFERFYDFGGAGGCVTVERRGQLMQGRVRGIKQDQSEIGKNPGKQFAEGAAQCFF